MNRYNIRCIGGHRLNRNAPCFVERGQLLACCVRSTVRLYSVYTGELCGELRHDAEEVAMLQCIQEIHLVTATITGNIRLWNTKEGLLVDTWKLQYKLVGFCIVGTKPLIGYFVLEKKNKVCNLYRIVLKPGGYFECATIAEAVPHDVKLFCFADRATCFAYITRRNLSILSLTDETLPIKHPYKDAANWVCIAGHPSRPIVATGDVNGVILIWNNLFKSNPIRTVCHWHTVPIGHLAFNQNGSALYSGGLERVVVKWNLRNPDPSEGRDYLPRIGSAVRWICVSEESEMIAVSLEDNSIQLVTSVLKITQCIQGIALRKTPCIMQDGPLTPLPAGLTLDITGLSDSMQGPVLILNGREGELQFYSLATNSAVFNLNITGKMLLPVEREKEVHSVDVSAVAVANQWMVTVEERQNDSANTDRKLKFWRYNRNALNFNLDTCVEYLPGTVISSVRFVSGLKFDAKPERTYLALATACLDGRVNFWTQADESSDTNADTEQYEEGAWRCRTTLSFRGLPANCIANSEPQSIVAIAFGCAITLWSANGLIFHRSMNVCDGSAAVRQLEFAVEEDVLLALSSFTLTAWSVRHLNRIWTVKMCFSSICVDPISGVIAAFAVKQALLLKVKPLNRLAQIECPSQAAAVASIFVPASDAISGSLSTLYYFTMDQYMYRIEWNVEQEEEESREEAVMFETVGSYQTQSWTSTLVGKAPLKQLQPSNMRSKTAVERLSQVDQSLVAPAHTLPSLDAILRPVLLPLIPDRLSNGTA
uniref:WD_REPEATS_REGION domain-containing protein n=1 Tax=Trichuris muris TaxID=70415 RepID=A0A5S6QVD0_TRIMR